MALPQDISPINSELQDTLVKASESDWIQYDTGASLRILYLGAETGSWAVIFRWKKGYVAGPHKHLSGSHTYVISGKLKVRDGLLEAGDYVYEANGMVHDETSALEDTDYLFICNGPLLLFSDDAFTGVFGWEELYRMRERAHAG
jgi:quercetin dioxygenase-like cupin family protein